MSSIRVNDVFEELSEENKRLLNELMFANKCLNVFIKFKTFIDLICDKLKTSLDSNDSQKFEELLKEVKEVFEEKENICKNDIKEENQLLFATKSLPLKHKKKTIISSKKKNVSKPIKTTVNKSKVLPKTNGRKRYRKYICGHSGCSYRSHHLAAFNDHMNTHNGLKPYECSSCGKTFAKKVIFTNHFKTFHELSDEILICEFCNKEFKTKLSFRTHQRLICLVQKRFECQHQNCNYKTINNSRLKSHIFLKHKTERNFKCSFEDCFKTFKTKQNLKTHQIIHNPNRFVRCPHEGCDQVLGITSLNSHFRYQHSGNKYSCDWPGCSFITNYQRSLKKHGLVHSTECNFSCHWPQCDKQFKTKLYLDRHMRIHMNDKRYACSWPGCPYRCTDDGNLVKHKRIHQKK